jgi:hypothetical protein
LTFNFNASVDIVRDKRTLLELRPRLNGIFRICRTHQPVKVERNATEIVVPKETSVFDKFQTITISPGQVLHAIKQVPTMLPTLLGIARYPQYHIVVISVRVEYQTIEIPAA